MYSGRHEMITGNSIAIIGAGRSGQAVARLASSLGFSVFVSDRGVLAASVRRELEQLGVPFEEQGHTAHLFDYPVWILSPAIPLRSPFVQEAISRGIQVLSEIDFAFCFLPEVKAIIGVTGTNGKTTTATLIHWILQQSGEQVVLAGNVGTPLSAVLSRLSSRSILVLELSSYQLEQSMPLPLDIAVLLNITPDHLSYHNGMENYRAAKYRIAGCLNPKNLLILNFDDPLVRSVARWTVAQCQFFGYCSAVPRGMKSDPERIFWQQHKEEEFMKREQLPLFGVHNLYNTMAAAIAARALEISNEDIRDSLIAFRGIEHRLEFVAEIDGVWFVNDSKATNVNSAWFALQSFEKPLLWIAGGEASDQSYAILEPLVRTKVRAIVAIGQEAPRIIKQFSFCPSYQAKSLEEAVGLSYCLARPGDVVLFSPACKSFDMFINFEHRGQEFKRIVYQLQQQLVR